MFWAYRFDFYISFPAKQLFTLNKFNFECYEICVETFIPIKCDSLRECMHLTGKSILMYKPSVSPVGKQKAIESSLLSYL